MVNRTAWTGGNLNGGSVAYQLAFGSEISTLANGSVAMSQNIFDNTTNFDEFMDISVVLTIAAGSTLTVGAGMAFWLAVLQGDNASYGEGRMTVGSTSASYVPAWPSIGGLQFQVGAVTNLAGDIGGIALRPCKFALIAQNLLTATPSNPAFASCSVWIRTYNQDLNH
jgi:hypothetical protein